MSNKKHVNVTQINAPIETVWKILTTTDQALPFFFGAICQTKNGLRVGDRMRMISKNQKFVMVVGEVLIFEPPHVYSHTFQMTNIDEPPCTVTYKLTENENGTRFELLIEGALEGGKLEKEMVSSQGFIAKNLKSMAELGRPAFSGRLVGILSPVFLMFADKKQSEVNWPL